MSNHNDNKGHVHDDKNISGTILQAVPPNSIQGPPLGEEIAALKSGGHMPYTSQLGRNQLCVSTIAGSPALFFRGDDKSSITQAFHVATEMKKGCQTLQSMLMWSDNEYNGLLWLTSNMASEDEDAETKPKPLDGMDEEKEA